LSPPTTLKSRLRRSEVSVMGGEVESDSDAAAEIAIAAISRIR
jgi:hypothetical protein